MLQLLSGFRFQKYMPDPIPAGIKIKGRATAAIPPVATIEVVTAIAAVDNPSAPPAIPALAPAPTANLPLKRSFFSLLR